MHVSIDCQTLVIICGILFSAVSKFQIEQTLLQLLKNSQGLDWTLDLSNKVMLLCIEVLMWRQGDLEMVFMTSIWMHMMSGNLDAVVTLECHHIIWTLLTQVFIIIMDMHALPSF